MAFWLNLVLFLLFFSPAFKVKSGDSWVRLSQAPGHVFPIPLTGRKAALGLTSIIYTLRNNSQQDSGSQLLEEVFQVLGGWSPAGWGPLGAPKSATLASLFWPCLAGMKSLPEQREGTTSFTQQQTVETDSQGPVSLPCPNRDNCSWPGYHNLRCYNQRSAESMLLAYFGCKLPFVNMH